MAGIELWEQMNESPLCDGQRKSSLFNDYNLKKTLIFRFL